MHYGPIATLLWATAMPIWAKLHNKDATSAFMEGLLDGTIHVLIECSLEIILR